MRPEVAVRFFELGKRFALRPAVFLCLLFVALFALFLYGQLFAAGGQIDPNGAGNTTQGTATTCTAGGNYECINDGVSSTTIPSTTGDYVTFSRNQFDSYQLNTLSNVSSVSAIQIFMYHVEGASNMQFQVSLWDQAESAQVGTTQNLTTRTSSQWDSVTFSGLSLNQSALDGLRVQTFCNRPGGGAASTCRNFALYAYVTYTAATNVTVSATGNQKNLEVGTTSAHIGGAFAITENTSSRNITSIDITEAGSVNAQTNLSNVRLFYELDTAAPYDCASVSYNGNENQFGATTTFDGADGRASFTGSVGITTTAAMCTYVVLDVGSGASASETLEVEINDPSVDVGGSGSPVIAPNTPIALPDTTNLEKTDLRLTRFHWRNDDGSEADPGGATSATGGNENTNVSLSQETPIRLRLEVSNEGNLTSSGVQYRLEYGQKVSTCAAISAWQNVETSGGDWDVYAASSLIEGDDTTDIAEAIGGVTNDNSNFLSPNGGQRESTSQTGNLTLTSSDFVELEYALVASTTAAEGNTYCFRVAGLIGGSATTTLTYTVYPEATIAADLMVSASGTQSAFVDIPSTDVFSGALFAITDATAGSHTVNAVTIHASGTVDYVNDIDNIELWYDLDSAIPYDCSGEAFGDGEAETQFGSTDTDGFTVGGEATFSGSVTVNPTQGLCLYVVYDVTASTTNGEKLDLQFNDPTQDIVVGAGSIAPATQVRMAGVTTFVSDSVEQMHYHWRNNDGAEGDPGATSATGGNEDTALSNLTKANPIRLRLLVSNEGGTTSPSMQYRLEYAQKVSTCAAASAWIDVGSAGGDWDMVNVGGLTDGNNTTNISEGTGGTTDENSNFVNVNGGQKDTSSQTVALTLAETEFTEFEFAILASSSAPSGGTYCFRLTNAGTPLDAYTVYPEATVKLDTDFFVQRGVSTLTGASITITAGVDYIAPSASTSAFIRITNTHNTGAGDSAATGNQNADDVTAYILDPWNIQNSITFQRATFAGGDTRIAWEIVEYKGSPGGDNEIVVRQQQPITYGAANTTVTTPTVPNVSDDSDIVVFITGQFNPDTGRGDYNTSLSTAAWNSGSDTATFTRGEAGNDAVVVSYAVVEFTGPNWQVQRSEHTYTNAGTVETESISAVGSLTRAFLHSQKRVGTGLDAHEDYGHEVWLSGVGQVSYLLDSGANTPGSHVGVAWVIENTQTQGEAMTVTRSNGSQSGGTAPLTTNINIGKTLDDLTVASIFMNNRSDGTGTSYPEPMISTRLISTTQYELWVSNTADTRNYRTEVVEWPTARRRITQNYYRLYVDNDALDPTDPWPQGAADLGENTEMTGFDDPITNGESIRIRMTVFPTAAAMPSGIDAFRLQYAPRTTTCSAISNWQYLGDIGSSTALWRGHGGTPDDGSSLSNDPPSAGDLNISVSDVAGTYEEENSTAFTPFLALVGEDVEFDWAIEAHNVPDKTDFCFRMVEADGTQFFDYDFYPVIRTAGYGAESGEWQWFDDAENETPSSPLAASNTAPIDINFDNTIQLRVVLQEVNGADETSPKFRLAFSESSTFASSTFVDELNDCVDGSSLWCYADGGALDNATITEALLTEADSCQGGSGAGCGTHNESGISTSSSQTVHGAGTAAEFAFTIRQAGARVNRVYYFRLYDEQNGEVVPLQSGASYPSLITAGASMTFEMSGIGTSTVIDGETIDVASTPTLINYGDLPFGSKVAAAHRLLIDSNGTEGYQVLLYSRSELLNEGGARIYPVSGTNNSPVGWETGCTGLSGCFGYHTTDATLSGGSSRFSPPDTFAQLSTTTPEEIVYSTSPTPGETIDIVYKLEVTSTQDPGEYETNIIYIAIPIF